MKSDSENIKMPKDLADDLRAIAKVNGTTPAHILLHAITMEKLFRKVTSKGGKFLIKDSKGKIQEIVP